MLKIKEMFNKQINRPISGVIKIGNGEENRNQELEEYVVTKELNKYFAQFFNLFAQTNESSQKEIGVWISGFYGSGKSHFMKILSYIIENQKINGKRPVDYFIDGSKIDDPFVIANMEKAAEMSTDVILFDIESMSKGKDNSKEAITRTFLRMFNETLGYDGNNPIIADFERYCDNNNQYELFKNKYLEVVGKTWKEDRKNIKFRRRKFVEVVTSLEIMAEEDANKTIDNVHAPYSISVSDFAKIVNDYCVRKGNGHRVVFLADEMGQYIAEDTNLLLNLQTISQDFSTYCKGKAWVVVTSQQNIDDITHVHGEDFSKIQARFNMRLSLSSSDVAEVIQKRILEKTDVAKQTLMAYYDNKEAIIKNLLDFSNETQYKRKYSNGENFANVYPFIPYQMDLLGNVLTQVRKNSSSGKHLAEGERSMLALIQESAVAISTEEIGSLVSFNRFYACLEKWIDHSYRNVIDNASRNEELESFDVELLKTLFMIKYVKEIKADIKNLTTLMVDHVDTDRVELSKKVDESLKRLVKQTYVQKDGDYYTFLTDAEQDLNRAIKNEYVENAEIVNEMKTIIFGELYNQSKFQYNSRYSFAFNQRIDDTNFTQNNPIGLVVITPYNDNHYSSDDMRQLTMRENVAVFKIPDEIDFQNDIIAYLQLRKYLTKNSGNNDPVFRNLKLNKQDELTKTKARIKVFIEQGLKDADVFINGSEVNIANKGVKERVNEALSKIVANVYSKLSYMTSAPDAQDFMKIFTDANNITLEGLECNDNYYALNDVYNFVEMRNANAQQVSYKNILEKFTKEPYGFVNNDVHWLLIKLFKTRKVDIKFNGDLIQEVKMTADNIIRTITSSQNFDKLVIRIKPVTSPKQIKAVNDICKVLDNSFVKLNDADSLIIKAKELFTKILEDSVRYETRYTSNLHLPGKNRLEKYKDYIHKLKIKSDPNEFYQYADQYYEDVLDVIEDMDPVFKFFNGAQISIFENAQEWLQKVDSSSSFINSAEINNLYNDINSIIIDVNPFNKIQNLPILCGKLEQEYNAILDNVKTNVKSTVNRLRRKVLDELGNNEELINIFEYDINNNFDNLLIKLDNTKTIIAAYNIETEGNHKKEGFVRLINNKKLELAKSGDGNDNNPAPVLKTLYADELFGTSARTIASEDDIDVLVNSIKHQLMKELNNGKVIKIKTK